MILNVDHDNGNEDIDLQELFDQDWVLVWQDLAEAIKVKLAETLLEEESEEISPDYVEDDTGTISIRNDEDWIKNLAKFAFYALNNGDDDEDRYKYFAYVDNEGWSQFNFDDMKSIDDKFSRTMEGGYAEYAREWMDDQGEDLPYHLEKHFDYESYGEELLSDMNVCSWGYEEYVFFS